MSNELKDILSSSNKDIDNQQLMNYLSHQLNKEEEHELEKAMADDQFTNDAVEGLQQFDDKKRIEDYVKEIDNDLKKRVEKNKSRKEKRKWKDQFYPYLAILIILILVIVGYIIIKKII